MEKYVRSKSTSPVFTMKSFIVVFLFISGIVNVNAQPNKPALERTITIRFTNERTDAVLNTISQLAKFNFSYNPAILDPGKLVTGNFTNKPVREILNSIFAGKLEYKERSGYVILQPSKQVNKPVKQPESFTFSGYVRDENGIPIPWVSIYDKASLESTVTNDYGYYRIKFSDKQLPLSLHISKQGYVDTIITIASESPAYINLILKKVVEPVAPQVNIDSLSMSAENTVETFFTNLEAEPNAQNIKDTLYRKYQVSLVPSIGTNLKLSGNVINEYSFNVLGGVSMGVTKAELGGLFNVNKSDVKYVQVAGLANLVGRDVEGVQIAGLSNMVRSKLEGVQIAGFMNLSAKSEGVQIAGFSNTTLDTTFGVQLAGFCNVAGKSMSGIQIAGFCNVVTDTVSGVQLGFLNYAGHLSGSQLGFINIAKSAKGVPVGFLSYVHNGYHKLELSADEIFMVNVAFRTGVNAFHNILTAGMDPFSGDSMLWSFGYGIGSSIRLSKKTLLDFDVTSSQIVKADILENINLLNKGYMGIDTKLAKNVSLAFGVTVNGQLTESDVTTYPDIFSIYNPNIFYDQTFEEENLHLQMWLGGKVALRFF